MLDITAARNVVEKNLPNGTIQAFISYRDLFVFQVFDNNDEMEGQWDPFYSVNKNTGEFSDFSIITDGDPQELTRLFLEAKQV